MSLWRVLADERPERGRQIVYRMAVVARESGELIGFRQAIIVTAPPSFTTPLDEWFYLEEAERATLPEGT